MYDDLFRLHSSQAEETQRLRSGGQDKVIELHEKLEHARVASAEREAELARQTAAAQGDVMAERARSEEIERLRVEKTMEAEKLQDQVVELRNSLAQLREDLTSSQETQRLHSEGDDTVA